MNLSPNGATFRCMTDKASNEESLVGPPGWIVLVELPFSDEHKSMELWFAGISDHLAAIEAVRLAAGTSVSIKAPQEISLALYEALKLKPGEVRRL